MCVESSLIGRMQTLTVALGGFLGQVYGVKALQENNGFTSAQCKCLLIVPVPSLAALTLSSRCSDYSCYESHRDGP